ncbi:MAG: pilus assembly protein [Actinobacteria bacterium]|nr:pilus assembly protein [Actinomycetota bacterium]
MSAIKLRKLLTTLNNEKGASAVEFAIILPVLILLIVGIIYFGFIFNNYLVLTHAAREGIRQASLHEDVDTVKNAILNAAASLDQLELSDRIAITPENYVDRPGEVVTVELSYPVSVEVPVIRQILELSPAWDSSINSLVLSTRATMRVE